MSDMHFEPYFTVSITVVGILPYITILLSGKVLYIVHTIQAGGELHSQWQSTIRLF
jgi:hypothetical protein